MAVRFIKMQAIGNNYIYINLFEENVTGKDLSALAKEVADIRYGIGSDGLILIGPSDQADIRMRMFNADGSEGKNCGNGLRSVARYAYDHGLVQKRKFQIETLSGLMLAEVHTEGQQVTIDMGKPGLTKGDLPMQGHAEDSTEDLEMTLGEQSIAFVGVSMGNPHAVIFVKDINQAPVTEWGPELEEHELFPEGVNVEFVHVLNERELNFRVWERGSGITYACGTGACAAVVAGVIRGDLQRDIPVVVHLLGGDLSITWKADGHVMMTGPTEYVCEGIYYMKDE